MFVHVDESSAPDDWLAASRRRSCRAEAVGNKVAIDDAGRVSLGKANLKLTRLLVYCIICIWCARTALDQHHQRDQDRAHPSSVKTSIFTLHPMLEKCQIAT